MRTLYALSAVGLVGVFALSVALAELGAPTQLVALYNVWLLGTVAVLVAVVFTLCFKFFSKITGGNKR